MKIHTALLMFAALLCPAPLLEASTNSTALIAHWTFDELSGLTAHDTTGNHDGQVSAEGAAFVADGVSGNALRLDRSQQGHVLVPQISELVTNNFSIVAWIKMQADDTTPITLVLSQHQSWTANGMALFVNMSGGAGVVSKASLLLHDGDRVASSGTPVNDGQWHQIVATCAQGDQSRIYVDGAPAEASISTPVMADLGAPFIIGGALGYWATGQPSGLFNGLVDDVQVYTGVLSDSQVNLLFDAPGKSIQELEQPLSISPNGGSFSGSARVTLNTSSSGVRLVYTLDGADPVAASTEYQGPFTLTTTTTVKAQLFVGQSPVSEVVSALFIKFDPLVTTNVTLLAHWKFDEASGLLARDAAGNYDGELSADGAAFVTNSVAGNALSLVRNQRGLVLAPHIPELVTNDFSIAAWIKLDAGDTTPITVPLSQHQSWTPNGMALLVNMSGGAGAVSKASLLLHDGDRVASSATPVNDGQWHQIVVTCAQAGQGRIYVDGAPEEAAISTPTMADLGAPFIIGGSFAYHAAGQPSGLFNGLIDDVQIYAGVLADAQVDLLFQTPGQSLQDSAEPLSISPDGGSFTGSVQVTLNTMLVGTTIRYTLDGSDPVASSTAYQAPLTLAQTTTVKARLFVDQFPASSIVSALFTKTAAIAFEPTGGFFTNSVSVAILNNLNLGLITFTTDGREPENSDTPYTGPIALTVASTIKARLFLNSFPISEVFSATFARIYALDDGIPNAWREQYFGPGYLTDPRVAATADPDADGWNNLLEYQLGSDPTDVDSQPTITATIRSIPLVSWNTVPGLQYRVLRKPSLSATNWDVVLPTFEAAETVSVFVDPEAPPTAVYVIELVR